MMDDQEFKKRADESLQQLYKKLASASDRYDFEPDFNSGALSVEFEQPKAKFVVSPNSPVRQIWVSAHSKSFKFDWDPGRSAFVLPETGQTLEQMMSDAISKLIEEPVSL
jgi:CyaY protein